MSTLDEFLLNVRVADGLDIAILSVVIYIVWRWLHRRTTHTVAIALLGLGVLYVISHALHMYMTVAIFQAGLTVILFALVVIFQDDLRHAVDRISSWRLFASRAAEPPTRRFVDTLVEAVSLLANEKTGALIILPGREALERHMRGGIAVEAVVSVDLLHSIFNSASRGHDGGVIIRDQRIDRLGVHLPLSSNLEVVGNRGTRHTAALGLSERTDALVIVVSEERGSIALAKGHSLVDIETPAELEKHLLAMLKTNSAGPLRKKTYQERLSQLGSQLASLLIAATLWFIFGFRIETVQRTVDSVPVEYRNLPEAWVVEDARPSSVRVTLVGSERAFDTLDQNSLKVAVDLKDAPLERTTTPIGDEHLNLPDGISLRDAEPAALHYQLATIATVELPIKVITRGKLPDGWKLVSAMPQPQTLAVHVTPQQRNRYEQLTTEPIDLSHVRQTKQVTVQVQLPQGVRPKRPGSTTVRVELSVERLQPTPQPDNAAATQ